MKKRTKISLSSEQTIILAALLNYNHIFAVDDMVMYDINKPFPLRIRNVLSNLEDSKILSYDFNGTLKLSVEIKKIIDAICNPDLIIVLDGTIGVKKRQTDFLMMHDEDVILLRKNWDKNDYYIYSQKDLETLVLERIGVTEVRQIHEVIDEKTFIEARENVLSFQRQEASDTLKIAIKDMSIVEVIVNYIFGRNPYLRIQVYGKEKIYKIIHDYFVFEDNGKIIKVSKDSNNYYFDSFEIKKLLDAISRITSEA